jgi:hypothetical protein
MGGGIREEETFTGREREQRTESGLLEQSSSRNSDIETSKQLRRCTEGDEQEDEEGLYMYRIKVQESDNEEELRQRQLPQ